MHLHVQLFNDSGIPIEPFHLHREREVGGWVGGWAACFHASDCPLDRRTLSLTNPRIGCHLLNQEGYFDSGGNYIEYSLGYMRDAWLQTLDLPGEVGGCACCRL